VNQFVERAVETIKRRREIKLARCYRGCFLDPAGALTIEGARVLADLRTAAKLFHSGIRRDGRGVIDRDELLRLEGRREIVLRMINLLDLDPLLVGKLAEVDDA
jgi:hypothetical protein